MPLMDTDSGMTQQSIAGGAFGFSARRIDELQATEYTLVTIAVDETGSVSGFERNIEDSLVSTITGCRRSPRADNLLVRVIAFASGRVREIHGFKPLVEIDSAIYSGAIRPGGLTNLRDAVYSGVAAMNAYGDDLTKADYGVNGFLVVITDGDDNASSATETMIKAAIAEAVQGEKMESLLSILVGVGSEAARIAEFKDRAGFDQYVKLGDFSPAAMAKLAGFVSKSISAQSQSLGSGGASQALTF